MFNDFRIRPLFYYKSVVIKIVILKEKSWRFDFGYLKMNTYLMYRNYELNKPKFK